MAISNVQFFPADNGGRRSGIDRRQFSYNMHIPERRATQDRRSDKDRRVSEDRRKHGSPPVAFERRSGKERRAAFC